ncbi:MAG: MFS transporter [Candidatus Thorarchaeota archaeon]
MSFLALMLISGIFHIWVFSFYFSAVGLSVQYIMTAFIIWSLWNAVNDPLIGLLSDKTKSRWGRRKPYIMIGTVPTIITAIIVFIPPLNNQLLSFIYLILILFLFDTFYTMLEVPLGCLFPELYFSIEERAQVNSYSQTFSIIGLIGAFLIPGLFIDDITVIDGYLLSGIIIAIIMVFTLLIAIKWGVVERPELRDNKRKSLSFLKSLQYTLKNRGFILYTIMFLNYEYITVLQGTVVPLYSKYVLKIPGSLEASILLAILFVVAIFSMIFWKKMDIKSGSRSSFFIAIFLYFISSIPLIFIESYEIALIVFAFMGFGFGGLIYFIYLIIVDVIDEDEINTGQRREGSFYGITAFFLRFANILSIISVSLIFTTTGWEEFKPNPGVNEINGLKILIFFFPALSLGIISLCLYMYPYTKSYVQEIKAKIKELHKK